MGRSVGYGHQCDYEECDYRQECLLWAGVSGMGRSVGYGQECDYGQEFGYTQECDYGQECRVWAGALLWAGG